MLRGNYPATVDAKGRLKIPTAFKAILDETYGPDVYVTSLDGNSVRIYPMAEWRKVEEKLKSVPSMNKARQKFLDRTNYYGQTGRMDAQGRILIPAQLRDSAAMRGEVAVMGNPEWIDVWNTERFREHLDKEPLTDDDLSTLSGLGI